MGLPLKEKLWIYRLIFNIIEKCFRCETKVLTGAEDLAQLTIND